MLLQLNFLCAFTSPLLNTNVSWEISAALGQSGFPKVPSDCNQTHSDVHAYKMFYSHSTGIYFILSTYIETDSRKQYECTTCFSEWCLLCDQLPNNAVSGELYCCL